MRIAVLADIHGNLPALRAVLAELDADPVAAIVVAGDQVAGPFARATLEVLDSRAEPVHYISGNGEREAVAADPDAPPGGDASGTAIWAARDLGERRTALRGWPIRLSFDGVCFCHGSPRRDDEIVTRATPDAVIAEMLADTDERLVAGGHTHQQMIRAVDTDHVYANAGSVGLPFEGRPGAFWMLVADGTPHLRVSPYPLEAARAELAATGFPGLDDFLEGSPFDPLDPDWVTALFEHGSGRGAPPGEPRRPA
ncbi:MAG: metallophosphoesterase family protein [Solirubrobacteraceae bacterium]